MAPFVRFTGFAWRRGALAAALALAAFAGNAYAGKPSPADATARAADVRVESVRPRREALPTLRFLKANRDFFRSRLDRLREQPMVSGSGARDLDPRFLAYRGVMIDALAANDSLGHSAEVASLESELDQMDRVLEGGRSRLAALQADFTGRQRTSLEIVLRGYPQDAELDSLFVRFDDGSACHVAISVEARESLLHRGVLEVFHGRVEPRDQVLEVSVAGRRLARGAAGYVSLTPARDRLTFLQLDLSALRPGSDAPAIVASTWLHDDALSTNGEPPPHP